MTAAHPAAPSGSPPADRTRDVTRDVLADAEVARTVDRMAHELLEKTGGETATERLVESLRGLTFASPQGGITFRPEDHQSTMGAYVGYTTQEGGKGTMRDWYYADGAKYLPGADEVAQLRPAG